MNNVLWVRVDGTGASILQREFFPYVPGTPLACWDRRILWHLTDGSTWLDGFNDRLEFSSHAEYPAMEGWRPVNHADTRLLWRHDDGRVSLWNLDAADRHASYREHGPHGGWTAVNYADDRLLWRHADGRVSLWNLDAAGNVASYREHGPFGGWTAVNYADDMLLWRHTDGRASVWMIDGHGAQSSYQEHAVAGMVPHFVRDGWLYWRGADRRQIAWRLDETAARVHAYDFGQLAERVGLVTVDEVVAAVTRPVTTVLAKPKPPAEVATWMLVGVPYTVSVVLRNGMKTRIGVEPELRIFNPTGAPIHAAISLLAADGTPLGGVSGSAETTVVAPGWWSIGAQTTARFHVDGHGGRTHGGTMMIRTIKSAGVVAERIDNDGGARTPLTLTIQA